MGQSQAPVRELGDGLVSSALSARLRRPWEVRSPTHPVTLEAFVVGFEAHGVIARGVFSLTRQAFK